VQNYGKSATLRITVNVKAILLKKGDKLSLAENGESMYTVGGLQPGGQYPEIPEPPYRPATPFIYVVDIGGNRVEKSEASAQEYLTGNSGRIAVIAQLVYSDFAGIHRDRLCTMVNVLRAGRIDESNKDLNVTACQKYNHQSDAYSQIELPSFAPPETTSSVEIICALPKD
jgi:hypothetical protein